MLDNVKQSLHSFGKYIVQQSRSNLTKQDKNVTKQLYDSIGYEVNVSENSFSFKLLMDEYADYQDSGVRGANPNLVNNGKQKAPLSPYTFRNKMPPVQPLIAWAKKRNIRFRTQEGRFAKGNYRTIGFWLQKRIYAQGIKPTHFWSRPFALAFKRLPEEIVDAFALDLTDFIKFTKK
jgi:hypothetical protein